MLERLKIGLQLAEEVGSRLGFLRRGRTWLLLKIEGKVPVLKEKLASLERIRAYFLSKVVGR